MRIAKIMLAWLSAAMLAGCTGTGTLPQTAVVASARPLVIMTSGGFAQALDSLEPDLESRLGLPLTIVHGSSAGGAPDSIPERLKRGEAADLVVLSREGLAVLAKDQFVQPDAATDLVRSTIGIAVREGAPRPNISTPETFVAALRAAPSIGYSASASGTYLATELWPRLGLTKELLPKSRRILSERVGAVVARGEVAVGLQQMSELLSIPGITVLGPIPEAYQKVTIFTAVPVAGTTRQRDIARLLQALDRRDLRRRIAETGLEPIRHD